jgi:ATP-dependent exoDNAse (exonuclease V) alpha subunit
MWLVKESAERGIVITNDECRDAKIPRKKTSTFDVCQKSTIELSNGDKVRITRNRFDKDKKRLDNGTYLEVASINKLGEIKLVNKKAKINYKVKRDFGFIDYSYCTTSHSSQGKTVDEVFISQPAATFPATDAKQFYVSVSRGKDKVTVYTDDKDALLQHASEIGDRQSAIELVGNASQHQDYILLQEREAYQNKNTPSQKTKETIKQEKERDYEPGF